MSDMPTIEHMRFLGIQVPAHFGNPEQEYETLRESVGLIDLSGFTVVRCAGADHREYLNRRLSQKTDDIAAGDVRRATLLGAEGRMLADMELVADGAETLAVSTPATSGSKLIGQFDQYVFTEDAKFTDDTTLLGLYALVGPKATDVLGKLGLAAPSPGRATVGEITGVRAICWHSQLAAGGFGILLPLGEAEATLALVAEVSHAGGGAVGLLAMDTLRVECGIPWWGVDLGEKTIPLDAGLLDAINYDKGCYPGQETIAKITNLGHPARQLLGVIWETEDPPSPGAFVTTGDSDAGILTSSTYSPRLGLAIGLVMLKWAYREPGTSLKCGETLGTVVELPFA